MRILDSFVMAVALVPIVVGSVIAQPASGAAQKGDTLQYSLRNCLNEFSMETIEKTAVGYQYWFVGKELAGGKTLKMSVVRPRSSIHAPHTHAEEEFFFVLEGKIEFYLNGERKVVGPNTSLYCPPNIEHGIRNVGDTEAKYLVVKKYVRE